MKIEKNSALYYQICNMIKVNQATKIWIYLIAIMEVNNKKKKMEIKIIYNNNKMMVSLIKILSKNNIINKLL